MSSPEQVPMPPRGPSLQRRLALVLSVALGAMLVLLFMALDRWIGRELYARIDASLLDRARAIAAVAEAQPDNLEVLRHLMPEYELPGHADFFEIWDEAGVSRFRSASSMGRTLARPPEAPRAKPFYYDLRLPDGHEGRAVALLLEVDIDGRTVRLMLGVASERTLIDLLNLRIHYALMAGGALALALTLSIALWAVRRSLTPVLRVGERIAGRKDGLPVADALQGAMLPRELQPFAQALDAAFTSLHEAIERERRFSRDVAHELRTPLAEIRLITEVAARTPSDVQAVQAAFAASLDAVERMQRAVDTLLQLARYEAGHTAPALDPLDLSALLDAALDTLALEAAQHEIVWVRDYGAAVWVRSDVGALECIVSNLLCNAIAYAPAGSCVSVCVEVGAGALVLRISNLAPDLQVQDLAHLGERFWRKSPGGGTAMHAGLGLTLVLALARSLELQVDFELARGSLSVQLKGLTRL